VVRGVCACCWWGTSEPFTKRRRGRVRRCRRSSGWVGADGCGDHADRGGGMRTIWRLGLYRVGWGTITSKTAIGSGAPVAGRRALTGSDRATGRRCRASSCARCWRPALGSSPSGGIDHATGLAAPHAPGRQVSTLVHPLRVADLDRIASPLRHVALRPGRVNLIGAPSARSRPPRRLRRARRSMRERSVLLSCAGCCASPGSLPSALPFLAHCITGGRKRASPLDPRGHR
jgi:hypothetical protein